MFDRILKVDAMAPSCPRVIKLILYSACPAPLRCWQDLALVCYLKIFPHGRFWRCAWVLD